MIKKLRYILKNYYKIAYVVEHCKEIAFLVENYELIRDLDKDVYKLKEKMTMLESKKAGNNTKSYSIAGVPKGQKDYVLGLINKTGEDVLEKKMMKRGDK